MNLTLCPRRFRSPIPPLGAPSSLRPRELHPLRSCSGQRLKCGGRDHSVKRCRIPFNSTGVLNPGLGNLNDGGYAFQQWQHRMLSHRRGQYERHVQRNTHSNRPNSKGQHASGISSNNCRHHSNPKGQLRGGSSNKTAGSQWSNNSNNQRFQGISSQQLPPPSAHGPLSATITVSGSTTQSSSAPNSSNMHLGPSQHGGNTNSRPPDTFRTNWPVDGGHQVATSPAVPHASVPGASHDARVHYVPAVSDSIYPSDPLQSPNPTPAYLQRYHSTKGWRPCSSGWFKVWAGGGRHAEPFLDASLCVTLHHACHCQIFCGSHQSRGRHDNGG